MYFILLAELLIWGPNTRTNDLNEEQAGRSLRGRVQATGLQHPLADGLSDSFPDELRTLMDVFSGMSADLRTTTLEVVKTLARHAG